MESIINCINFEMADVILFGIPYERTCSFGKGASRGPLAVVHCLNEQIELYERTTGRSPAKDFRIASYMKPVTNFMKPSDMIYSVGEEYKTYYEKDKFIILLGGEHTVTLGALHGIYIAGKPKPNDITIVQIDAHFDLRNDDSDYAIQPHGRFSHSCVMRRAFEMRHPIVSLGIRRYSEEEILFARNHNVITFFEWGLGQLRGLSQLHSISDIIDSIQTDAVYLTVDVDGIDPSEMPATGTPVAGGMTFNYAFYFCQELMKHKNVIGMDIVEVAPSTTELALMTPADRITVDNAAQLLYSCLAWKLYKK